MQLMCLGRQLPKIWGQSFVLCCLGLRKDQGCGKERGREGESGQGHAASGRPWDVVSRRLHAQQHWSVQHRTCHHSRGPSPWLGNAMI